MPFGKKSSKEKEKERLSPGQGSTVPNQEEQRPPSRSSFRSFFGKGSDDLKPENSKIVSKNSRFGGIFKKTASVDAISAQSREQPYLAPPLGESPASATSTAATPMGVVPAMEAGSSTGIIIDDASTLAQRESRDESHLVPSLGQSVPTVVEPKASDPKSQAAVEMAANASDNYKKLTGALSTLQPFADKIQVLTNITDIIGEVCYHDLFMHPLNILQIHPYVKVVTSTISAIAKVCFSALSCFCR